MTDDASAESASPTAIIGAGAVGTALARRLEARSGSVDAIISRNPTSAQALAQRVGATVGAADWATLPADVRLVMVCVPDDAIGGVAEALASLSHPWERTVVAHTSGARTSEALAPLAREDAATMSFHPLQTFAPGASPDVFDDIVIGIEGASPAVSAGKGLARTLGARPVVLTRRGKVLYHCAAALASNGLVALMSVVQEVFGAAELEEAPPVADLVGPLVEQTWANLSTTSPEGVLTGPVARGDDATVQAHLERLGDAAPHLVPVYAALSTEMLRVAVRGGHVDGDAAERILKVLQDALPASPEDDDPMDSLR